MHHYHYANCKRCATEKPTGVSMEQFARLSVAFSQSEILIHCERHDIPVLQTAISDLPRIVQKITCGLCTKAYLN